LGRTSRRPDCCQTRLANMISDAATRIGLLYCNGRFGSRRADRYSSRMQVRYLLLGQSPSIASKDIDEHWLDTRNLLGKRVPNLCVVFASNVGTNRPNKWNIKMTGSGDPPHSSKVLTSDAWPKEGGWKYSHDHMLAAASSTAFTFITTRSLQPIAYTASPSKAS
jgi:hypothetical protein